LDDASYHFSLCTSAWAEGGEKGKGGGERIYLSHSDRGGQAYRQEGRGRSKEKKEKKGGRETEPSVRTRFGRGMGQEKRKEERTAGALRVSLLVLTAPAHAGPSRRKGEKGGGKKRGDCTWFSAYRLSRLQDISTASKGGREEKKEKRGEELAKTQTNRFRSPSTSTWMKKRKGGRGSVRSVRRKKEGEGEKKEGRQTDGRAHGVSQPLRRTGAEVWRPAGEFEGKKRRGKRGEGGKRDTVSGDHFYVSTSPASARPRLEKKKGEERKKGKEGLGDSAGIAALAVRSVPSGDYRKKKKKKRKKKGGRGKNPARTHDLLPATLTVAISFA